MARAGQRVFPEHGTVEGYRTHLRWGPMPPCDACKDANRLKTRAYRAKMVTCRNCKRTMPAAARYLCEMCYRAYLRRARRRKPKVPPSIPAPDQATDEQ